MGWEKEMFDMMRDKGHNVDVRIFEGEITKTAPLTFRPYGAEVEMNARFCEAVANGAADGQVVLAIQDMSTRSCYVIARLS